MTVPAPQQGSSAGPVVPHRSYAVRCNACKRYLCTVQFVSDLTFEGDLVKVTNIRCTNKKCKYKNGFTVRIQE